MLRWPFHQFQVAKKGLSEYLLFSITFYIGFGKLYIYITAYYQGRI